MNKYIICLKIILGSIGKKPLLSGHSKPGETEGFVVIHVVVVGVAVGVVVTVEVVVGVVDDIVVLDV